MLRVWAVSNCLILWVIINYMVLVRVRICDMVRVTVRVIVTVRVRVSSELGSGKV